MSIFGSLGSQLLGAGKQLSGIMPGDQPFPAVKSPIPKRAQDPGQWSTGKRLLGGLLDGILSTTGGQPINLPMMLAQRQRTQSLEDEQRKREQELEDAIALARAKAQFREPTAMQQNFSWFQSLNPEQQKNFARYQDMTRPLIPLDMQTEAGGPVMRSYMPQSEAAGGVPSGSPLAGAPNSRVVNGKQYWLVNGEWYDNPEGR